MDHGQESPLRKSSAAASDRTIDFRYAPSTRWTCIGRPDDPYKTLVREDGALLYDFLTDRHVWGFGRVVEIGIAADHQPIETIQRTEEANSAIVVTEVRYAHAILELIAFGHQHDGDRRSDVVLWTIRAGGRDGVLARLRVVGRERQRLFSGRSDAPANEIFAVDIAQVALTNPRDSWWPSGLPEDLSVPAPGPLVMRSIPHRLEPMPAPGFDPIPALGSEGNVLRAGESVQGALIFPLNHAGVGGLDFAWAQAALESERAFWRGQELVRLPMAIPDLAVMEMVEACTRNILQAREVVDGLPQFQVGPTIFRGLWVVDGHFLLESAQYLGYREEAAAGLEVLLRRVRPDGSIAEMPYHIKETAIAVATFVRQSELLGDDAFLRRSWPTIRNAVAHIEAQRRDAYALPPDSPAHGLLPPAFPDGGIGGRRPEYTSALWTLAGLKMVADAARRLGYTEDAGRFQADFDELLVDFRRHVERDLASLPDGTPYLPMAMPGSGDHTMLVDFAGPPPEWRRIRPQTGTWALAQAIYPGEVFAPDDPLVRNFLHLLDAVDDDQGIPCDTAFWTYRMIWTYSASFYAHAWLYAGRPDKAIDYLYAFANHAAPTRVWREEQAMVDAHTGFVSGDMPHNWASAEFIRLVRHLLVFERGETLELLPGLPDTWLVPGEPLRLERTPTRFGPVSLRADVDGRGEMRVELGKDGEWPRRPERTILHVPAGWEPVSLTLEDDEVALDDGMVTVVELPDATRLTVRLDQRKP